MNTEILKFNIWKLSSLDWINWKLKKQAISKTEKIAGDNNFCGAKISKYFIKNFIIFCSVVFFWVHSNLLKCDLPKNENLQFADKEFVAANLLTHYLLKKHVFGKSHKKLTICRLGTTPASRPGVARCSLRSQAFARPSLQYCLSLRGKSLNNVSVVKTTFWQIVSWQIVIRHF